MAEDDAVRAHPLLGAEPHGARRGGGDRLEGPAEDLLLRRLRGEDVELPPLSHRLDEHREEGGGGLADAGRRLDEELPSFARGAGDRGGHLALAGAEAPEREGELAGLGGFRLGEGELSEELRERRADARHEVLLDLGGVERDGERLRVARLDVGEDEPSADGTSLGACDGEEVPLELAGEAVEPRRAHEARQLLGEVDRLHLVDDDGAVLLLEAPVEAALQDRGESVDGEREPHRSLDGIAVDRRERFRQDAPVDGLPDPPPLHRVAAAVPDPPGGGGEERARRERDGFRGEVDPDRHAAF